MGHDALRGVLVDDLVLGVLDGVVGRRAVAGRRLLLGRGLLVDLLREPVQHVGQAGRLGLDVVGVLAGGRALGGVDGPLEVAADRLVHLVAVVLELALGLVHAGLGRVARVGDAAQALVLVGVRLGVAHHVR